MPRPATKPRLSDNLPRGTGRKFSMAPHGYYDSAAEIIEATKSEGGIALWRSKTRCSTTSEWMEVGDATSGQALWRIEARFGDRCVPHNDVAKPNSQWYITVLRLYRGYETKPQLLLVYRSQKCSGLTANNAHRDIEVYLCNEAGQAAGAEISPDDELEAAMAGDGSAAPKYKNIKPATNADETFVFAELPQGEDAFTLTCNETFTKICLTSTLPDDEGAQAEGRRVLASLQRTNAEERRTMTIDPALDVSLVTALFCAVDQLMVSHDAIEYDVEWPQDYAYILSGACLTSRKSVRQTETFTNGMVKQEGKVIPSRGCLPFF